MNGDPFDGRRYLVDKSAWVRARHPNVVAEWSAAVLNDQIAICAITKLEILFSAQTSAQYEEWDEALSALPEIAVTRTVCDAAVTAMGVLAAHSDGYHRIAPPDWLIAAAAQEAGIGVLHYDGDFDRLKEVFHFESRWIAPAGTIP